MLSRLMLDRNTDVPLFRQLRAAIEMRIIDGTLADGSNLPSIRTMATELGISNVTVIQAYNDLQAGSYIRSVPKRGFFVTSGRSTHNELVPTDRLTEAIDRMFAIAIEDGIGERNAIQISLQRLRDREDRPNSIAIVGYLDASLAERVVYTRQAIADIGVKVKGISFEALELMDSHEREIRLQPFELLLVSVGETEQLTTLLNGQSSRILPMTRTLRSDVIETIENQPTSARFGIIASNAEYADRMIAELRRVRPESIVSVVAQVTEDSKVQYALQKSDVILVGSIARSQLPFEKTENLPLVEFHFMPDAVTIQRLRNELEFARSH